MGLYDLKEYEYGLRMDELSVKCLLYDDDHVIFVLFAYELQEMVIKMNGSVKKRGMKVNVNKTKANGFLGAAGPAGGIPNAYSLIAKKFWEKVIDSNQMHRIQMLEYERSGWTFHAKGLWYYPSGSKLPCMTLVGSANLGERSVRRDLEAQAAILTTSPQLQVPTYQPTSLL
ncbi:CDP-diacylglycerol--glycerol-3-phosphate 3-phosphatidyltransferase, mitochondrial [Eumeta japonica]|uniref:CDP-diacylglycerol--glycerol-3-phosphate 3-phosphatidyltransferase n=1 Tax=Eumeta variegata TaxID=151549 RepID=A0A4C1TVN6_EUMVA|nr:CDP-diacylglycerol--glycerol-3-phosphate 3-phosphatidyltransferase, mitochondrial [Eumeta japonica]